MNLEKEINQFVDRIRRYHKSGDEEKIETAKTKFADEIQTKKFRNDSGLLKDICEKAHAYDYLSDRIGAYYDEENELSENEYSLADIGEIAASKLGYM